MQQGWDEERKGESKGAHRGRKMELDGSRWNKSWMERMSSYTTRTEGDKGLVEGEARRSWDRGGGRV